MIFTNTWDHTSRHLAGGGLCILKNENGASCVYSQYSINTETYEYVNNYLIDPDYAETQPDLRLLDVSDGLLDKEDQPGFGGTWQCSTLFAGEATTTCKRQLPSESTALDELEQVDFRFVGGDSVTLMQYIFVNSTNQDELGNEVATPGTWKQETIVLNGAASLIASGVVAAAAMLSF